MVVQVSLKPQVSQGRITVHNQVTDIDSAGLGSKDLIETPVWIRIGAIGSWHVCACEHYGIGCGIETLARGYCRIKTRIGNG